MQNLHDDKNLDDLSRRAAEDYEPDPDLHSWESLRPGLEAALPQKKERKRRFLVVFLLFLLIGGGVVFSTVWNDRQETADNKLPGSYKAVEKPVAAKHPATTGKQSSSAASKEKAASPKNSTSPANSTANTTPPLPAKQQQTPSSATTTPASTANVDEPVVIAQSNKNQTGTRTRRLTSNKIKNNDVTAVERSGGARPGRTVRANRTLADNNHTSATIDNTSATNDHTPSTALQHRPIEAARIDDGLAKFMVPRFKAGTAPLKQVPAMLEGRLVSLTAKPSLKKRWEFGAVYAPDVSTVRFTHTQKPGTNFGLTIAYNLSNRFAIQTGAIYTTKNYKLRGKDYHPPKGYWTDYVKLETVAGDCTMWDIPLNLRYNLAPRRASNLFASAGLSTYLMQKEDYDYYYYYNGNPMTRYRSYDSDSKYWFGMLNLSVAYERQMSRTISLQAEPFFKQPLKGVGFGSIKMNTTGIYFSVKYRPLAAGGRR